MITLTREQSRAARCYLNWTRVDLARAAHISPETIKNFETARWQPSSSTKTALIATFEASGLEFIEGGVKRKAACVNCGYPHGFVLPDAGTEALARTVGEG